MRHTHTHTHSARGRSCEQQQQQQQQAPGVDLQHGIQEGAQTVACGGEGGGGGQHSQGTPQQGEDTATQSASMAAAVCECNERVGDTSAAKQGGTGDNLLPPSYLTQRG